MIIVIANQKGGVGKSTISTNLACIMANTKKTLLVDHDISHVSYNFFKRREHHKEVSKWECFLPTDVDSMLAVMEGEDSEVTIVDLGGFIDDLAKVAYVYADLIVVPTSTSTQDMDGNVSFMDTFDEMRKKGVDTNVVFMANNTNPAKGQPRIDVELDYITDRGYKLIGTVPHYAVFDKAHGLGKSVIEVDPKSRAADCMLKISEAILEELDNGTK